MLSCMFAGLLRLPTCMLHSDINLVSSQWRISCLNCHKMCIKCNNVIDILILEYVNSRLFHLIVSEEFTTLKRRHRQGCQRS